MTTPLGCPAKGPLSSRIASHTYSVQIGRPGRPAQCQLDRAVSHHVGVLLDRVPGLGE